ncbi:hypothetical protein P6F26_12990 [Roseibacterium sp. SDUM158017]|uniref:hypothetical protein n=1 Tax=Roseicyclus salinarum TaxID=3036773 RepID=UPI002414F815|nr:hypothetical protein [Roseibacterium sp. SDUM158017]MDG4649360.1 hypothetical protein [Roseibacterium sp. SDUM158017]
MVALLAYCVLGLSAEAGARDDAWALAEMWQPIEISVEPDGLTIVLPQRRVTQQIYLAILQAGLCLGPLLDRPISDVGDVRILNQFARQGFVFEGNLADCYSLSEIEILGVTHAY